MLITRGTVNIGILVYSLWMALLCTLICLVFGYPAAYFMADRDLKYGAILVVLFVIPMWMNFLLRTIAWMTLLEDNGLINTLLRLLGLPHVQLMYNDTAVLLGMVYNFLPFMVFPIYTALDQDGLPAAGSRAGSGRKPGKNVLEGHGAAERSRRRIRDHDGVHAVGHDVLHPPHPRRREHDDVRRFD